MKFVCRHQHDSQSYRLTVRIFLLKFAMKMDSAESVRNSLRSKYLIRKQKLRINNDDAPSSECQGTLTMPQRLRVGGPLYGHAAEALDIINAT